MKRRTFLRGLSAAPAVALLPVPPQLEPAPATEPGIYPGIIDYDREYARIFLDAALENPALVRAMIEDALEAR